MPFPNEHSGRIAQPLPHNSGIFARKQISQGIFIVLQKSKGDANAPMKAQSYRFNKKYFTPEQARKWLKDHDIKIMSFEPASDSGTKETMEDIVKRISKELSNSVI